MKTLRSSDLAITAVTAVLALAALPVRAQQTLRVDDAGNPTTPLNLSGDHVIGTVPPAHLGTGTPSSATVLRGDGSWVGTTSTGNTVAATANVLMGDGAGNALGISAGTDLYRVLRTRLESLQSTETQPANLLPQSFDGSAGLQPGSSINPDGTMTVPANGSLRWSLYSGSSAQTVYGCIVATTDQPAGALVMHGNYGVDFASVDSTLLPGVYRSVFTAPAQSSYGLYNVFVRNTTAAPITIYYPVLADQDAGLALLASGADHTPVAVQPVADFDFTRFADADRTARYLAEKQTTLAADSVNGSATAAGTLYAPKFTLQQTVGVGSVFGLYRGGLFRDSLPLSTLGNTHGVVVQDLALGSVKELPVVSALDPVAGSAFTGNGDGTYTCTWAGEGTLANDGYQNVYVVEINTTAEAATPVAARRRMIDASSQAAAAATPGSVFVQRGSGNNWTAALHPSDGLAPGGGAYRYEVVARFCPANWGAPNNVGDGGMSGVELVGGSWGYGSLGTPVNFVGDRLAILHATTHGAVIGGGSLQRSVFYESGDPTCIQLAWYASNGAGLRWHLDHCLFYANAGDRVPNFLISHTSGASFDRGDISDCAFLAARWSDGSLRGTGLDYVNVTGGVINRVYVQGVADAFGGSMPPAVEIKNSVFRQVNQTALGGAFHDNLVAAESGSNPADVNHRAPIAWTFRNAGAVVTNNLFLARGLSTAVTNDNGASAFNFYPGVTTGTATRNIVVVAPANAAAGAVYCQNLPADVSGVSLDYNLVICTAPQFYTGAGRLSWAAYRAAYPTLDAHSLYVDLSGDPRGWRAVFADPDNGDFRWAQTEMARRCAAYCQANHVGPAAVPSRWPVVPTVDEAVRLLTGL